MTSAQIETLALKYIRRNPHAGVHEIDAWLHGHGFKGRYDRARLAEVLAGLVRQNVLKMETVQQTAYVMNGANHEPQG